MARTPPWSPRPSLRSLPVARMKSLPTSPPCRSRGRDRQEVLGALPRRCRTGRRRLALPWPRHHQDLPERGLLHRPLQPQEDRRQSDLQHPLLEHRSDAAGGLFQAAAARRAFPFRQEGRPAAPDADDAACPVPPGVAPPGMPPPALPGAVRAHGGPGGAPPPGMGPPPMAALPVRLPPPMGRQPPCRRQRRRHRHQRAGAPAPAAPPPAPPPRRRPEMPPGLLPAAGGACQRSRTSRPPPASWKRLWRSFLTTTSATKPIRAAVKDVLLPGRGTCRVRWKPVIESQPVPDPVMGGDLTLPGQPEPRRPRT